MPTVAREHIYKITDANMVFEHGSETSRVYPLKIRDLPSDQKPREKLLAQGPHSLSSSELLAVVLNTGTKKENVLSMSNRALKDYGPRSLSRQTNANSLAEDLDIPLIKAVQIVACGELGRRFFDRPVGGRRTVRTTQDVFAHCKEMGALQKEHLRGIYLNTHHKIIHDEVISIGTLDANIIHPREVFRPAIEHAAAGCILVHNHPSGSTTPSLADIDITAQIVEAGKIIGIDLMDHVIVTKSSFASIIIDSV